MFYYYFLKNIYILLTAPPAPTSGPSNFPDTPSSPPSTPISSNPAATPQQNAATAQQDRRQPGKASSSSKRGGVSHSLSVPFGLLNLVGGGSKANGASSASSTGSSSSTASSEASSPADPR